MARKKESKYHVKLIIVRKMIRTFGTENSTEPKFKTYVN